MIRRKNTFLLFALALCVCALLLWWMSIDVPPVHPPVERTPDKSLRDFYERFHAPDPPFRSFYVDSVANSTQWIVLTSINAMTPSVRAMLAFDDFSIVVVADARSPEHYDSSPRLTYLTLADQRRLGYFITAHLPLNSYTRKNIGYLFAIAHGAHLIYDTDDDNAPDAAPSLWTFDTSRAARCVVQDDHRVINPYALFGHPDIWPRGLPLETLHLEATGRGSVRDGSLRRGLDCWVQQGMADLDPDVDAVFRMTRSDQLTRVVFQRRMPVHVPPGLMAPFNSQATLFSREAFFSLLLPTSVSFRLTDIWRSYYAQRLMWMAGGALGFVGPTVRQLRNPHSFLRDYEDERVMYEQSGALIRFLIAWKPTSDAVACGMFCVMRNLADDMARAQFWAADDVALIDAWIADLRLAKYAPPPLLPDVERAQSRQRAYTDALSYARTLPIHVAQPMTQCWPDNRNAAQNKRTLRALDVWFSSVMPSSKPLVLLSDNDGRGLGGQLYDVFWIASFALSKGRSFAFAHKDRSIYDGAYCGESGGFSCFFEFPAVQDSAAQLASRATDMDRIALNDVRAQPLAVRIGGLARNHIRDALWGGFSAHGSFVPTVLYGAGWTTFHWFAYVMHRISTPRPFLVALIDEKKQALGLGDRCVAVHIRKADKLIEHRVKHYIAITAYADEVARIAVEVPVHCVFVTSDDGDAIDEFSVALRARVPTAQLIYDKNQTRYRGRECSGFDASSQRMVCPNRANLAGAERADWALQTLLDFYLLSSCEYLVGSIGSFFTRAAAGRLVGSRFLSEPFPEHRIRAVHFVDSLDYITQHDNNTFSIPSLERFFEQHVDDFY